MHGCVLGVRFPPLSGALFFLLVACSASPTRVVLGDLSASDIPPRMELSETPFFAQTAHQCGPAALATVLAASGQPVNPDLLARQVYLPQRRGSLQLEMLAATRRHGRLGVPIDPELPALLKTIAAGHPVLVLQNLSLAWLPRWHYAVVIGYDLDSGELILRSGGNPRLVVSLLAFERTWVRSGRWAMVALSPGALPPTVNEKEYLTAALAFEKLGKPSAALQAYDAAVRRWPASVAFWMGLGNAAYNLHDWSRAEQAYRRAAAAPGDPVPALNNLALALAAQGRRREAIEAAEQAVAAGGFFSATARATLAELRASAGTEE